MLLKLSNEHHKHLKFLQQIDDDVAKEFAAIALQFLQNGIKDKTFRSVAQKLKVEVEVIENCIMALMQLFVEVTKVKLNDVDLQDSLIVHGFSTEFATTFKDLYRDQAKNMGVRLAAKAPKLPRYKNMEWRLDIKLASRSLYNQLEPSVLLKLAIENHSGSETKLLCADVPTLLHMISELEDAIVEDKTKHVQRFVRNLS